ncbi:hypothetical protein AVEN_228355-1 [Araneus ventricosus]|uniref:DDE-1 domain-containing protein n=1 Tax=Araneus ventricosus TaxID=182803 RepID=A0A4Y2K7R9_ARAVE|nr:hypothetical protein AVEN_228355-1 [Araneus ventricosus]
MGLPSHTSHKPLDVAIYGSLKTAYNVSCSDFMVSNPGHTISIRDVAGIFGKAYLQVANPNIAIKGFASTGIEQLKSSIFTEEGFTPSLTTKIRHEKVEAEIPSSNNDPDEIDVTSDLSIL